MQELEANPLHLLLNILLRPSKQHCISLASMHVSSPTIFGEFAEDYQLKFICQGLDT